MQNTAHQHTRYTTSDLGIAVFLFTVGHELVETRLIGNRRLSYSFERLENTDRLVSTYLNGTGEAPAKQLFENYRSLRGMAFAATGNLR